MTDISPAQSRDARRFFPRQATGLTREVSWIDAMFYNLLWSSLPLSLAFILAYDPALYSSANPYIAVLAALVLTLPCALMYAMFSSAIPRSGGDYTWITRALSPTLGFMSSLSFCAWITFFIGVYSDYLGTYGIAPMLRILAADTQSRGLLDTANWFTTETGAIVVGLVVVAGSALLLTLGAGLRTFMKLQKGAFALWALGAVALPIVLMLFISKATFISNFNTYILHLGGPSNAYSTFVASAPASNSPATFSGSLLMVTLPFYTLGFIFQSAYFGGEIKRARKTALRSIVVAELLAAGLLLIGILVFRAHLSQFLYATGAGDYAKIGLSSAPQYPEIAAIASGNAVVGTLISIGMIMVFLTWIPQSMLLLSRSLFAWSFDRLLPAKLAQVNSRTRSPAVAVGLIAFLSVGAVLLVGLSPSLTFVVGLMGLTFTYVFVSIAGIAFPYRQKDTFEASPFNRRIGRLPVMTLLAVVSTAAIAIIIVILLRDKNSGTSWDLNRFRVELSLGILVAGFIVYQVIKLVQKARGVDVELAYREIPPE
jgi:basic amino acid/polyamine antiporter, APA family